MECCCFVIIRHWFSNVFVKKKRLLSQQNVNNICNTKRQNKIKTTFVFSKRKEFCLNSFRVAGNTRIIGMVFQDQLTKPICLYKILNSKF